jgi:hypothetical protein
MSFPVDSLSCRTGLVSEEMMLATKIGGEESVAS